ncbi:hypothetical protein DFH27DRAFT_529577 [Peziza echinospora]|nr:hypothetical protein DFH27DRAFT_529577 [Peziza echinospora]
MGDSPPQPTFNCGGALISAHGSLAAGAATCPKVHRPAANLLPLAPGRNGEFPCVFSTGTAPTAAVQAHQELVARPPPVVAAPVIEAEGSDVENKDEDDVDDKDKGEEEEGEKEEKDRKKGGNVSDAD